MKLFKVIIFIIFIILSVFTFNYFYSKNIARSPISSQNNFYNNLELAINTAKITTSSYKIRDFNNEVEFHVITEDNQIKVLISTLKDPFWQVATLQQVVKTAKMNQGKLKLVDLSSKHPYGTYKNN